LGISPGGGHGNPLQSSYLENPMDRGVWSMGSQKGGVICISEVIDISPSNLDSSLCFIQPGISHDMLCM